MIIENFHAFFLDCFNRVFLNNSKEMKAVTNPLVLKENTWKRQPTLNLLSEVIYKKLIYPKSILNT